MRDNIETKHSCQELQAFLNEVSEKNAYSTRKVLNEMVQLKEVQEEQTEQLQNVTVQVRTAEETSDEWHASLSQSLADTQGEIQKRSLITAKLSESLMQEMTTQRNLKEHVNDELANCQHEIQVMREQLDHTVNTAEFNSHTIDGLKEETHALKTQVLLYNSRNSRPTSPQMPSASVSRRGSLQMNQRLRMTARSPVTVSSGSPTARIKDKKPAAAVQKTLTVDTAAPPIVSTDVISLVQSPVLSPQTTWHAGMKTTTNASSEEMKSLQNQEFWNYLREEVMTELKVLSVKHLKEIQWKCIEEFQLYGTKVESLITESRQLKQDQGRELVSHKTFLNDNLTSILEDLKDVRSKQSEFALRTQRQGHALRNELTQQAKEVNSVVNELKLQVSKPTEADKSVFNDHMNALTELSQLQAKVNKNTRVLDRVQQNFTSKVQVLSESLRHQQQASSQQQHTKQLELSMSGSQVMPLIKPTRPSRRNIKRPHRPSNKAPTPVVVTSQQPHKIVISGVTGYEHPGMRKPAGGANYVEGLVLQQAQTLLGNKVPLNLSTRQTKILTESSQRKVIKPRRTST
jgi:hypothetical protein